VDYTDRALGTMRESEELGGAFTEVVLQAAVGFLKGGNGTHQG
jgi:hypothetical protein